MYTPLNARFDGLPKLNGIEIDSHDRGRCLYRGINAFPRSDESIPLPPSYGSPQNLFFVGTYIIDNPYTSLHPTPGA